MLPKPSNGCGIRCAASLLFPSGHGRFRRGSLGHISSWDREYSEVHLGWDPINTELPLPGTMAFFFRHQPRSSYRQAARSAMAFHNVKWPWNQRDFLIGLRESVRNISDYLLKIKCAIKSTGRPPTYFHLPGREQIHDFPIQIPNSAIDGSTGLLSRKKRNSPIGAWSWPRLIEIKSKWGFQELLGLATQRALGWLK